MAIIDTSKGVRPCVEELAALQNGNVWGDNKHTLFPWYIHENSPQIAALKPGVTSRGVTIKYEGCGIFSIKGEMTQNWNGTRYSNVSLEDNPIPFDLTKNSFKQLETNSYYRFYCPMLFDNRSILGENTSNIVRIFSITFRIPLSDGTNVSVSTSINANNYIYFTSAATPITLVKQNVPEGTTPLFENAYITGFSVVYNFTNVSAGTYYDITSIFNIYCLWDYFDTKTLSYIYEQITNSSDRMQYILAHSNILQIMSIDNINNALYTISSNTLQINTTTKNPDYIAPVTNIYHLPTEGE